MDILFLVACRIMVGNLGFVRRVLVVFIVASVGALLLWVLVREGALTQLAGVKIPIQSNLGILFNQIEAANSYWLA
jgi:hypothetical protein